MNDRKIPPPLDKTIPLGAQEEQHLDPYRKGFKKRELGDNSEVQETHLIVPRPTFGQRLSNLFWSTAAVTAAMCVVKHYDAIEATVVAAYTSVVKHYDVMEATVVAAGLGG